MSPVIRIDDEVMEQLKQRAVALGLVFGSPNEVLRAILGLDGEEASGSGEKAIEVQLNRIYTPRRWALIPVPKNKREFFPGYKMSFELATDVGTITAHVTSDMRGTRVGDPKGGKYIQGGLRSWYDRHPELTDGAKLRIEALTAGRRYKLSIVPS